MHAKLMMTNDPLSADFSADPPPPAATGGYEVLHERWVACLDRRHRNSIMAQLYEQTWRHAIYKLVLAARRGVNRDEAGAPMACLSVHALLDKCYLESSIVAVRRLLDRHALDGTKGVHSLRSLVDDMRKHRDLFTRRNWFAVARLPMDAGPRTVRFNRWVQEMAGECTARILPTDLDTYPIESLHSAVDQLCGVAATARTDDDTIRDEVFQRMHAQLDGLEVLNLVATKFLAHAATIESIEAGAAAELRAATIDVWKAHETFCRIVQLIDCYVLRQTSHGFLPIPTTDVLRHIEIPLASASQIAGLRDEWDTYRRETESWGNTRLDWLDGAMR